jgi:hypothetical protein
MSRIGTGTCLPSLTVPHMKGGAYSLAMYLPVELVYYKHLRIVVLRAVLVLTGLLFFAGASSAATLQPDRLGELQAQDLRVANVAYRLSVTNVAVCRAEPTAQFGFVLHSIEQYGLADRAAAGVRFGLNGRVAVMAVVGQSPASQAGLVAGDRLVSVNGRAFPDSAATGVPGRTAVDNAEGMLRDALQHGTVVLRVDSRGRERDLRFTAERGCPSAVELIPGDPVNAWADGTRVMIGEGLLARCTTDADLALVIGHEMAHNLLHHRQRLASEGVTSNTLLPMSALTSMHIRQTEEEADRLAVRLASNAAYDLSGAELFLGGLIDTSHAMAATHPAPLRRLALLHAAIAGQRRDDTGTAGWIAKTASIGLVSGKM